MISPFNQKKKREGNKPPSLKSKNGLYMYLLCIDNTRKFSWNNNAM